MITVLLQGAEFFAHHGYYAEEQLTGGRFVIDLSVSFVPRTDLAADDLSGTVNYEQLYKVCCNEMKEPRKLIETVAGAIVDRIKESYPFIQQIELTLKKLNPPLGGSVAWSGIKMNYNKADVQ